MKAEGGPFRWMYWLMPVIPATSEIVVGGSLFEG
jgi:hypothetical protein